MSEHEGGAHGSAPTRDVEQNRGEGELPFLRRRLVYVVGLFTILAMGFSWPVMSVGVSTLPALWLSTVRLAGGGICITIALALTGRLTAPPRQEYPVLATVMLVRLAFVTGLVFTALRFVPPGRSSVLVYTAVLWTAVFAGWFLGERITRLRVAGVVVGASGVVVLVAPWSFDWSDRNLLIGHAMLLAAAVAHAVGAVHIRGHRWSVSPVTLMPWQLTGAGLILAVAAFLTEGLPPVRFSALELGVIAYQVLIASALGFWGTLTVTRNLPATTSQLMLMAVPAIGVAASALLLAEPLTLTAVLGMLLVFVGATASLTGDSEDVSPRS